MQAINLRYCWGGGGLTLIHAQRQTPFRFALCFLCCGVGCLVRGRLGVWVRTQERCAVHPCTLRVGACVWVACCSALCPARGAGVWWCVLYYYRGRVAVLCAWSWCCVWLLCLVCCVLVLLCVVLCVLSSGVLGSVVVLFLLGSVCCSLGPVPGCLSLFVVLVRVVLVFCGVVWCFVVFGLWSLGWLGFCCLSVPGGFVVLVWWFAVHCCLSVLLCSCCGAGLMVLSCWYGVVLFLFVFVLVLLVCCFVSISFNDYSQTSTLACSCLGSVFLWGCFVCLFWRVLCGGVWWFANFLFIDIMVGVRVASGSSVLVFYILLVCSWSLFRSTALRSSLSVFVTGLLVSLVASLSRSLTSLVCSPLLFRLLLGIGASSSCCLVAVLSPLLLRVLRSCLRFCLVWIERLGLFVGFSGSVPGSGFGRCQAQTYWSGFYCLPLAYDWFCFSALPWRVCSFGFFSWWADSGVVFRGWRCFW